MLLTVPPNRVPALWPLVLPLLEASIALSRGRYRPEDVRGALKRGAQQLWLWLDGETPVFGAVTEIVDYPGKRVLAAPWVGGRMSPDAVEALMAAWTSWGRSLGCAAVEGYGRDGWARTAGLERIGVLMEREIGHG